ncbi:unnamed protein product, partial [Phaeothamnion confervicola]
KFFPYFNFVGRLDDGYAAPAHAEALLRLVGAWEAYGASGWERAGTGGCSSAAEFMGRHGVTAMTSHVTPGRRELYYSPALLRAVQEAYGADYTLLRLFDEQQT